jgi:Fe2+ transport system protein FeoA
MFTPFSVAGCSLKMGVTVGTKITLIQRFPSLQIKTQDRIRAINWEIARIIYVRIVAS